MLYYNVENFAVAKTDRDVYTMYEIIPTISLGTFLALPSLLHPFISCKKFFTLVLYDKFCLVAPTQLFCNMATDNHEVSTMQGGYMYDVSPPNRPTLTPTSPFATTARNHGMSRPTCGYNHTHSNRSRDMHSLQHLKRMY